MTDFGPAEPGGERWGGGAYFGELEGPKVVFKLKKPNYIRPLAHQASKCEISKSNTPFEDTR